MACRARGSTTWPRGSARSRPRCAGGAPRANTGSTGWSGRARRSGEIKIFAEGLGQAHDHVLVLGIGGSALGTKALLNALRRPAWNEWDDEGRDFFPRLTVLENVDPTTVAAALRRIDPRRVLVNVISKSGGTAETMAQYLVVRAWLEDALGAGGVSPPGLHHRSGAGGAPRAGDPGGHRDARVPPDVGGRYSVLSPVGLLPAALVGIDIEALLAGATRAVERAESDDLRANPAALYAALHWAADTDLGARVHVLMPYTDRLKEFAEWYRQLWAESLGKRVDREGEWFTSARHRWAPLGRRTSTARCSSSWRGRSTK